MKKRIVNGVELIFMLAAFIILWIPCIKIQYIEQLRYMPIDTHAIGIMSKSIAYTEFIIFGITALMCIVSIIVKPEHKDGKMHVIMPTVLFLYSVMAVNVAEGNKVGSEWIIVESKFPWILFFACLALAIATSIIKRSSLITGIKSKTEKTVINNINEATNADELKKYKDLLDNGTISQEEFDAKKKQLLGL